MHLNRIKMPLLFSVFRMSILRQFLLWAQKVNSGRDWSQALSRALARSLKRGSSSVGAWEPQRSRWKVWARAKEVVAEVLRTDWRQLASCAVRRLRSGALTWAGLALAASVMLTVYCNWLAACRSRVYAWDCASRAMLICRWVGQRYKRAISESSKKVL